MVMIQGCENRDGGGEVCEEGCSDERGWRGETAKSPHTQNLIMARNYYDGRGGRGAWGLLQKWTTTIWQ